MHLTKIHLSLLALAASMAFVTLDHAWTQWRLAQVNGELDVLVEAAKRLELRLRDGKTVYVGDIMDEAEMFEFMTDGRMSVVESPGTTISWDHGLIAPVISSSVEPGELEPVVVVRSFANGCFGMAFVYRGVEVYRSHSLYDAIDWFMDSGL